MAQVGSVRLSVLGSLDLRSEDGCAVEGLLVQPKRLALLVFLSLAGPGDYRRRDVVLPLFWPEADEDHARNALSRALYVIRQHLGPGAILNRGADEVGVSADRVRCDGLEFREAMARDDFSAAVDAYRGPFLDGFHVRGLGSFDHWQDEMRTEFQSAFARAIRRVARSAEESHDPERAEATWRRLLCSDPGNSEALLGVMRALVCMGARSEAMDEAHRHEAFLRQEFGLEPDPCVVEFVVRLRRGA